MYNFLGPWEGKIQKKKWRGTQELFGLDGPESRSDLDVGPFAGSRYMYSVPGPVHTDTGFKVVKCKDTGRDERHA